MAEIGNFPLSTMKGGAAGLLGLGLCLLATMPAALADNLETLNPGVLQVTIEPYMPYTAMKDGQAGRPGQRHPCRGRAEARAQARGQRHRLLRHAGVGAVAPRRHHGRRHRLVRRAPEALGCSPTRPTTRRRRWPWRRRRATRTSRASRASRSARSPAMSGRNRSPQVPGATRTYLPDGQRRLRRPARRPDRRRLPRPAAHHLRAAAAARHQDPDRIPDAADRGQVKAHPGLQYFQPYMTGFYLPKQEPKLTQAISDADRRRCTRTDRWLGAGHQVGRRSEAVPGARPRTWRRNGAASTVPRRGRRPRSSREHGEAGMSLSLRWTVPGSLGRLRAQSGRGACCEPSPTRSRASPAPPILGLGVALMRLTACRIAAASGRRLHRGLQERPAAGDHLRDLFRAALDRHQAQRLHRRLLSLSLFYAAYLSEIFRAAISGITPGRTKRRRRSGLRAPRPLAE